MYRYKDIFGSICRHFWLSELKCVTLLTFMDTVNIYNA